MTAYVAHVNDPTMWLIWIGENSVKSFGGGAIGEKCEVGERDRTKCRRSVWLVGKMGGKLRVLLV